MKVDLNNVGEALAYSLQHMEENRRKRAAQEAEDRMWPSELLEDVLDADEVVERTGIDPNPIIGLTNII